jgi:hypothetical protein
VAVAIPVAPPVVSYPVPAVTYYAPATSYAYPVAPAYYAEPAPTVTYYSPDVPTVAYAPVVAPVPYAYVPGRYQVKFYPYGQPVRNIIRAVIP